KGNTTDIKSEVTREINAQYNYFAEGEAKTEGTIDTTNSLAEEPTDEDVVLGHEISGKIILNSVIKSSEKEYEITDDLIIIGKLTVEPGVTLKIAEDKSIIVRGTLVLNGSEDNLIYLKPDTSILIKGKWNGIKIEEGGYVEFDYVKSGYADAFMDINGEAVISNSTIVLNNKGFIVHENKELNIQNSKISSIDQAFLMYNSSKVNLENVSAYSISQLTPNDNVNRYNDGNSENNTKITINNSNISVGSLGFNYIDAEINESTITVNNYDTLSYTDVNINNSSISSNSINIDYYTNITIDNSEIGRLIVYGGEISTIIKNSTLKSLELNSNWGVKNVFIESSVIKEFYSINEFGGDLLTKDSTIAYLQFNGNISGNIEFNNIDFKNNYNNNFYNEYLLYYNSSYSMIFDNCRFTNDSSDTNYSRKGVYIGNGAMIGFKNSDFEDLDYGIYIDNGALLTFEGNQLINNNYGIYFNQFVSPDVEQEISGNYLDNKTYNIYNNTSNTVRVNGNFWGTTNEEEIKNKLYNVEIESWLESSPIQ
ncbi:hypothetical protein XO12_07925, partial [Marinitoga sp. 1154]